jgi:protease I
VHTTRHGYKSAERDLAPEQARASDFDAVIVPGGFAPDTMRNDAEMLRFVRDMDRADKIIAAICHGPWVPVSAGIAAGRTLTCFPSIRADVVNAGAIYRDEPAVRERNFITSRTPDDLPAFCDAIVSALGDGECHARVLDGKRVAVLADDFHDILQFWISYYRMCEAGARVQVVSRAESHLCGDALPGNYASKARDLRPVEAHARDFDAVIIPGGLGPDYMRADEDIVRLVREMDEAGKITAAICRGAWLPVTAQIVKGRTMTCNSAIRADLENAGARYLDREVVKDKNLISARSNEDLAAFCREVTLALSTQESVR